MSALLTWAFRRFVRDAVRQGNQRNGTRFVCVEIIRALQDEFSEDNNATLHAFLSDRVAEAWDEIDRAERCTAGHGGALCDKCFSAVTHGDDAVREAETVYCDVCGVDRRRECIDMTNGDRAMYPHPERTRIALAARGGE